MHLVDNLVLLSLRIAGNKTLEHFVSLLGFSNRDTLLGLEDFFVFGKHLLPNFLLSFSLVFRELKKGLHFPSNLNQSLKGLLYVRCHPFLIDDLQEGNDVDEVLFIVPVHKSGHLEVGSIWHPDLDLLGFLPLV